MLFVLVTLDMSHSDMLPLNDTASSNRPSMLITLDTSHCEMSPLKVGAPSNIPCISVTCATCHLDMLLLKNTAPRNNELMSVTSDTSHFLIGPWGPEEQSPTGDIAKHALTAALRCRLILGVNSVVRRTVHTQHRYEHKRESCLWPNNFYRHVFVGS